jgi:ActD protein
MSERGRFGLSGSFASPDALIAAARQLRSLGLREIEAYTPYPVDGLDQLLRPGRRMWLPLVIFVGAVLGAMWGYFVLVWDEVLNYPINVGGRPYHSWPAFVVGAFEFTLLCAITAGFFALLAACRLPRLYHPIFSAVEFERASVDRFVLCVEAHDPSFEPHRIRRVLERHGAQNVAEVPA